MFTLRKDGRYQGYYYDEKNIRHSVCNKDPEKLYVRLQAIQEPKESTFKDIAEGWEKVHREEIEDRTWKNYEPHYNDIIEKHGSKTIEEVTALDVLQDLKQSKAKGLSATIVNTRRSLYKMIFDYAIINGYTQFNPVAAVSLPKGLKRGKRKAPTDDEIKIILKNIDVPFGFFPFFLLCTGLRKSEALCLQWSDIDFESKIISVVKSIDYINGANPKIKCPKSEAGMRTVQIIDVLLGPLQSRRKASTSNYLFPAAQSNRGGAGGGIMTERGYEGAWKRYCEAVGFIDDDGKPTLTAHNFRHGTATLMFESDVDEITAQKTLGHSKVETTREIYTELREQQKSKSISKFNDKMAELMADAK